MSKFLAELPCAVRKKGRLCCTNSSRKDSSKHTIPSLHSASGIASITLSSANPTQFLACGNDGIVQLYEKSTDKVLTSLTSKKIHHVAFRKCEGQPTPVRACGQDGPCMVFRVCVRRIPPVHHHQNPQGRCHWPSRLSFIDIALLRIPRQDLLHTRPKRLLPTYHSTV